MKERKIIKRKKEMTLRFVLQTLFPPSQKGLGL